MGLTRAWIGAGAMSVVATQWDIPDDTAQGLMTDFYRELRADPRHGVASALRNAQLSALRRPDGRKKPESWAGYFLLSRAI
jgi:CHAT domain-containing protein